MTRPDSVGVTAGNRLPGSAQLTRCALGPRAPRRSNVTKATLVVAARRLVAPPQPRAVAHLGASARERPRDAGQVKRPGKTRAALIGPGDQRAAALGDRSGPLNIALAGGSGG